MNDKKIKILVVDDDKIVRETYTDIFQQEGFEVVEAIDGLDGLDKASKENPDVVFTGIIMPRMDGFSLVEALKKNVVTAKIPIIMLSHIGREEDRKKAEDLGVKEFMIKGMVGPKEVVRKIREIFGPSEYKIKFGISDLDAPKLAQEINFGKKFECPKCSGEMMLNLKISDINKHEFTANFFCPKCG